MRINRVSRARIVSHVALPLRNRGWTLRKLGRSIRGLALGASLGRPSRRRLTRKELMGVVHVLVGMDHVLSLVRVGAGGGVAGRVRGLEVGHGARRLAVRRVELGRGLVVGVGQSVGRRIIHGEPGDVGARVRGVVRLGAGSTVGGW